MALTNRRFLWLLLLPASGALAVGAVAIAVTSPHPVPFGDAFYFHYQAKLLVDGKGWFVDPFRYLLMGTSAPSAAHPPLWTLLLALEDVLGLRSYLSHLYGACVVDAAAVFVTGLAAREAAGPRAGLVAAAVAAAYPDYWLNVGTGLSETLVLLLVASIVWAALRLRRSPGLEGVALLGVLCALAALTRAELILLAVVVLLPVVLLQPGVAVLRRLAAAAVGILAAACVLAPWVGFNLARMDHPELLSSELGVTLAGANCARTYSGPLLGSWSYACELQRTGPGDEALQDIHARAAAVHYARAHAGRLVVVIAARVGRSLGLFHPMQGVTIDDASSRPVLAAQLGQVAFWAVGAAGVLDLVLVRHRRAVLVPLVGIVVEIVLVAVATYGSTRLRTPLEVAVVVLAALAVDAALGRKPAA